MISSKFLTEIQSIPNQKTFLYKKNFYVYIEQKIKYIFFLDIRLDSLSSNEILLISNQNCLLKYLCVFFLIYMLLSILLLVILAIQQGISFL